MAVPADRTAVLDEIGTRTLVMGVLNVTPDSFSDGGQFVDVDDAVAQAKQMANDGADLLDVGGESTRPYADPVPLETELERVLPVVTAIRDEQPTMPISIDTYKAEVAERAIGAGADLVNDVSALRFDTDMARVIAEAGVPVILMHMKGTPQTMQDDPHYGDVVAEIGQFLQARVASAQEHGIAESKIVVDPGIGFGKRPEDNVEIVRRLGELKALGRPVLLGTSRKSFLGTLTHRPPSQRLEETIASVVVGAIHGADLVRVHDVGPIVHALAVADAFRR
ncbi:MAG: dihydropteroate synthase [Candidatus Bipolaricaulia bacterium]